MNIKLEYISYISTHPLSALWKRRLIQLQSIFWIGVDIFREQWHIFVSRIGSEHWTETRAIFINFMSYFLLSYYLLLNVLGDSVALSDETNIWRSHLRSRFNPSHGRLILIQLYPFEFVQTFFQVKLSVPRLGLAWLLCEDFSPLFERSCNGFFYSSLFAKVGQHHARVWISSFLINQQNYFCTINKRFS